MDPTAALRALATGYAASVDRRDAEGLVALFHPEGTLVVRRPGRDEHVIAGPERLARVTSDIARWTRTLHVLGQSTHEIDGDRATGETYCVAHHFGVADDPHRHDVLYIRYQEECRRDDGRWRFGRRVVQVDAVTRAEAMAVAP